MHCSTFKDKKVLITGHTGFKGSWLSLWLLSLGAEVFGAALEPPTKPSLFKTTNLEEKIHHNIIDIRNYDEISKYILDLKPDFIFHLAAQSLVNESYINPIKTWGTNLMGTVNLLETLRLYNHQCICVVITSDKCYDNNEWVWGYRETDRLGGPDPYSASKGSAELAISSFFRSFFNKHDSNILIASARAGNVIGGGDWAKNRIIPDCIRAWTTNKKLKIRAPSSTRPWQHVLEPLSGYLCLALKLKEDSSLNGESFNFGPSLDDTYNVLDVVKEMSASWAQSEWEIEDPNSRPMKESQLLKLNCDKALTYLDWKSSLNFKKTIDFTSRWYFDYYNNNNSMYDYCNKQIIEFSKESKIKGSNKWL